MKISDKQYLEQQLKTKRIELDNLNIDHRIAITKYETKKEMIVSQIDSLEKQLEE
jgi:hypothetical protein